MALVEVRKLSKQYRKGDETITPLDEVDLDVQQGEFLSLMGSSGSGKSTLLNLIAGIDRPGSGTIKVAGTEVTRLSRSQLADWRAAHLGYIFQTHNLIPVLTAYENVELPLLLHRLGRTERHKRVSLAMDLVGIADRHDHFPRQLSGGQEQRVAIARALVGDPGILVADEPTGDLDASSAAAILELLKRLNEELGKTVIMVTHDARAAAEAHTTLHLEKGKLVESVGHEKEPIHVVA